ncbi:MAG: 3-phosphoserine/phosphohydroxythreonine transaminase [Desulfobacterales bacterium]|nr:3-phosphoserine/phosphohydroxythreonine transaminase [Desulfobacterales bacterium]MDD4073802.1 3-phosphoserine/phosphohydroxythreonine transaminase [Desulfobacterales bacterium]MDD4392316.1 3-phosphoserine/phosphohydroxythreonine transaminase [Desulfobacterales bacterium]
MKTKRIYNFNAGPAALPASVLEQIQESFLNLGGSGMSITEISHRSKTFDDILNDAIARTKRLLNLDDSFHVLFIQGGASLQFCMIPMNLLGQDQFADYVDTGTWSTKAIKEVQIQGKQANVVASSKDRNFCYIPEDIRFTPGAAYVHITTNNTIKGTQWATLPDTGTVPLIADMSSDFMSRPFDARPFGLIYAGAQKNIGPAGACMVIIRDDMVKRVPDALPTMLKYTTFTSKNSLFNTPPCFTIYTIQLVLKWMEEEIGGLEKMNQINSKKAALIYDVLDSSDFYKGTADTGSRSKMNITFRLPTEELETRFIREALDNDMGGLKGHRSVGGCRASIYNAVPVEAVETLTDFMKTFEKQNG